MLDLVGAAIFSGPMPLHQDSASFSFFLLLFSSWLLGSLAAAVSMLLHIVYLNKIKGKGKRRKGSSKGRKEEDFCFSSEKNE